jgi:hypothetical protein
MKKSLVTIIIDNEITVHLPHPTGIYLTLCGLDGDDPSPSVDQRSTNTVKGSKVNSSDCRAIFDVAHQYSEKDFV